MSHRVDRSLLLEHDPAKLGPITLASLRDADWRHQSEAMKRGYSSMAEWAIDELIGMVRELSDRLDVLEQQQGVLFTEELAP